MLLNYIITVEGMSQSDFSKVLSYLIDCKNRAFSEGDHGGGWVGKVFHTISGEDVNLSVTVRSHEFDEFENLQYQKNLMESDQDFKERKDKDRKKIKRFKSEFKKFKELVGIL